MDNSDLNNYQSPPKDLADVINAPSRPGISMCPLHDWVVILDRPGYPSIEELAKEELRLAGLRIEPNTHNTSRSSFVNGIKFRNLMTDEEKTISNLPEVLRIENLSWSPDGQRIAFSIAKTNGLELWTANLENGQSQRLTDAVLNNCMNGLPYFWGGDSQHLYFKAKLPESLKPQKPLFPSGPVIQENNGKVRAARTYQDLLKNSFDEAMFEYFTTSKVFKTDLKGNHSQIIDAKMISGISISPDGNYLLILHIQRPFSYQLHYQRFPITVELYDKSGNFITTISELKLADEISTRINSVRTGPRNLAWRSDQPASLFWVEALDEGNPEIDVESRDKIMQWSAPFTEAPIELIRTTMRFAGVKWSNGNLAIVYEWWWKSRTIKISAFSPDYPDRIPRKLFERNYEDRYNSPGDFETTRNKYGRQVLLKDEKNDALFLLGSGASEKGDQPFLDKFFLKNGEIQRLWQCEENLFESPIVWKQDSKRLLISRESPENPPNFYYLNLEASSEKKVTDYPHPYPHYKEVSKELVQYKRADGVELSGKLYLPKNFVKGKSAPLPTLMWAYPKEYKSADTAGQVNDSPHKFIGISAHSPLYWVNQGYAIFDAFSMPIIGEGDEEPNQTFVEQLIANAEAAVKILVDSGYTDPFRIAVGGHSYGAFMTANLLAHTQLFAAGIARSGAYNRTLTPFGFQSEERTYWEAPNLYHRMSPFSFANRIKSPLLLIHGEADNNSGTYPLQSERFYNALKGHGAIARLVMLPNESHGYQSRESILHMLWEMDNWLEKYVKNRTS